IVLQKEATCIARKDRQMNTRMSPALVAVLSLYTITVASAADISHSSPTSPMSRPAGDTLNLSSTQRTTASNDLHSHATKQSDPVGFSATKGTVVPSTMKLQPIPEKTAKDVPSLKPYDFAVMEGKVLIVNPSDKKVVEVISG